MITNVHIMVQQLLVLNFKEIVFLLQPFQCVCVNLTVTLNLVDSFFPSLSAGSQLQFKRYHKKVILNFTPFSKLKRGHLGQHQNWVRSAKASQKDIQSAEQLEMQQKTVNQFHFNIKITLTSKLFQTLMLDSGGEGIVSVKEEATEITHS